MSPKLRTKKFHIKLLNEMTEQSRGEIIIYRAEDNTVQLDVRMEPQTN